MITAAEALERLREGNGRFVRNVRDSSALVGDARRAQLVDGQEPFAIVLGCSDSRVPAELVFDQGFGDLFVIRVAGNVAGDDELASLEYAAEHLSVPLIVVLGHQKCGGVTAAVQGGEAPGHLPALMKLLQPAVEKTKGAPGDAVANAVRANVEIVVGQLRASKPLLAGLASAGKMKVVGGVYSLDTGRVDWLK